MAAPAAPLRLNGLEEGLGHLVDRVERRQPLREVRGCRVRVAEAGELVALLGLNIPGVGVVGDVGNAATLARVKRTAHLLRVLSDSLLPEVPTSAAHLTVLDAFARALRDDAAACRGGFNRPARDLAFLVDEYIHEAQHHAPYDGLRQRAEGLRRAADRLLGSTLTVREEDAPQDEAAAAVHQANEEDEAAANEEDEAAAEEDAAAAE